MSGRVEWCEIGGLPTDEERKILLASLERYLRSEPAQTISSWTDGMARGKQPQAVPGWGETTSWIGLQSPFPA